MVGGIGRGIADAFVAHDTEVRCLEAAATGKLAAQAKEDQSRALELNVTELRTAEVTAECGVPDVSVGNVRYLYGP